jgi:hypothetical protein
MDDVSTPFDPSAFTGLVRLLQLPCVCDRRGRLIIFDYAALPFTPCRSFVIDGVPCGVSRGGHAHKDCEQLLICLEGMVTVELQFKEHRAAIVLGDATGALYVGPKVWARERYYSDARLLVFASRPYDPSSYIRDPEAAWADSGD